MDLMNNCFTKLFLSKYPSLEIKTIETLLNNGYYTKETLMLFDLNKDLPLLPDINMAQKSVLRHVLSNLQKSEKFSIEVRNSLNNNLFGNDSNNDSMLKKIVKIEPKYELKTSIDCPEVVVKEESDREIIDIIYDSDIGIIDKNTEYLKTKLKKSVNQRVSANSSQEIECQTKIKTSERDIKKCDKSTTTRHSFKATTDESVAQSMSSNSSEKVKVKEEIKYELIDNFNESNVEEFEESKTFAQPLNSTINGSINESQPSIDVSNIGLNNEMMANLQISGNDMYFSLRQSSKLMTEIESVFKCLFPKCGKKFANSNGLRRHRLTHPEKKLKKIRKRSSKPMSTRSGLEFKLLTSTPIIPRRRRRINISKAEEANESQTQTSLSIGLSANKSVIKKLICEYPGCQKSFDKTDRFKRHFLTHSDIRPFDCPHEGCGKAFKERSTLLMHERIHSGEKPYACDYENCGKRFTQLAQIQAHKRIHTNHKPFVCNFDNCDQRFKQMSHLLCHERSIHTNEKPFLCALDGCNKRFAQMASLLSHSKIH
jgi:hypothetical protein